jgi:hypothetical protein
LLGKLLLALHLSHGRPIRHLRKVVLTSRHNLTVQADIIRCTLSRLVLGIQTGLLLEILLLQLLLSLLLLLQLLKLE